MSKSFEKSKMELNKKIIEELKSKFKNRHELIKKSNKIYQGLRINYPNILDKAFGESNHISWTEELLIEDAKKYNSKSEWRKSNPGAYPTAYKRGLLEKCCKHMEGNIRWTEEMLIEDAKKYKSRQEWKKSNGSAYQTAHARGLLDIYCKHMKKRV